MMTQIEMTTTMMSCADWASLGHQTQRNEADRAECYGLNVLLKRIVADRTDASDERERTRNAQVRGSIPRSGSNGTW